MYVADRDNIIGNKYIPKEKVPNLMTIGFVVTKRLRSFSCLVSDLARSEKNKLIEVMIQIIY